MEGTCADGLAESSNLVGYKSASSAERNKIKDNLNPLAFAVEVNSYKSSSLIKTTERKCIS